MMDAENRTRASGTMGDMEDAMTTAMVRVTGQTYPIKGLLREFAGRWDGFSWTLPAEKWARLIECYACGLNKRDRERSEAIRACTVTPVEAGRA